MVKTRGKNSGKSRSKKPPASNKSAKEKIHHITAVDAPEIPSGYNIDTIVLMPVNMDTSFVYWEVTDSLLGGSQKKLDAGTAKLMVKVYESDGMIEICSFEVMERIGKSYVNYQSSFRPLVAEIGVINGKGFVGLLKSRKVYSPSTGKPGSGKSELKAPGKKIAGGLKTDKTSAISVSTSKEIWMTTAEGRSEIVKAPSAGTDATGSEIIEYYRKVAVSRETPLFSMF